MNAIVVGGGMVGLHVARMLSAEKHDVKVIDMDASRLSLIESSLDVMAIEGNGASPAVLEKAGVGRADLLVAAANLDESNLIACAQAKALGVARTVARLHNPDYLMPGAARAPMLGIDYVINPEEAAVREIARLLEHTWAVDMADFAGGLIEMMAFRLAGGDAMAGRSVIELGRHAARRSYIIAAILRGEELIVPHGSTCLREDDIVYVIGRKGAMSAISFLFGHPDAGLESIAICGGTRIGLSLARSMEERGIPVKLVEPDEERVQECAALLDKALVIHGEGTDPTLLREEEMAAVDGFVAVTERDETNLLSAALVRRMGGAKTIALLQREDYRVLADELEISATVSTGSATADAILRFLRRGSFRNITTLLSGAAEIYELVVGEGAEMAGGALKELSAKMPEGVLVCARVGVDGTVEIPHGDSRLSPGDTAVVISPSRSADQLERLFGLARTASRP